MKSKKLLFSSLLALTNFLIHAQDVSSTPNLTSGGNQAGTSGLHNTFYGYRSGKSTTTGSSNVFIGNDSGAGITTGQQNFFGGDAAGIGTTTGSYNIFIGTQAGEGNNGQGNTFIGTQSGAAGSTGEDNVFLGFASGTENSGSRNTFLGAHAGGESTDNSTGNVFIGYSAGFGEVQNNKLNIDNSENHTPLIWGDFANDQLKFNGKVGIGYGFGNYPTTSGDVNVSNYNLFVKGGILTDEVRVSTTWADYVFQKDYKLPTLPEVEQFITKKGHLPNVPSAKEVAINGIELGEMAKIQQEKIEELTLYIIEQNKINEKQGKLIKQLEERLNLLEKN